MTIMSLIKPSSFIANGVFNRFIMMDACLSYSYLDRASLNGAHYDKLRDYACWVINLDEPQCPRC